MTDLLDRLENAFGPSRKLDVEIWRAMVPEAVKYEYVSAPRYTASLDMAMSLISRSWRLEHLGESQLNLNMWECELHDRNEDRCIQRNGATDCLAICQAAILASKAEAADPVVPIDAGDLRYW